MPINMSKDFEERVKKIKGAQGRGGGNYINEEGLFEVELLGANRKMALNKEQVLKGRQVRDQEMLIAEFRILSTTHEKHPVGVTRSWCLKNPSDESSGAGDLKDFCFAILGAEPKSVSASDDEAHQEAALLALAALGEDEAFKMLEIPTDFFCGKRLKLETKINISQKTGKPFTKHVWSPATSAEA